ncbi:hypothetical protein GH733_013141 [Mirounga leonina]|nr:hypothetical protein GH733_013141 [Mirounga leonina]
MTEISEPLKDAMPTERKSTWRTAEERRMSDLTRKPKGIMTPKTNGKEGKKDQNLKQQRGNRQVAFANQKPSEQSAKNAVDPKGKRLSIVPSNYKDGPRKSDLDIKDAIALESAQRPLPYRHQSILDPALQESPVFGGRKSTLLRDWVISRTTEISYERKLKSLMEKGTEPKVELVRMLKPEEVLSCRLSKNNIRTLLKLCKDAGMIVDIHPHMVEGDIDAKKVFAQNPSVAL